MTRKSVGKVLGKFSLSKADARYWLQPGKLRKWKGAPNYSIWLQFKGKRISLSTRTPNKDASAKKAAGIYQDLTSIGLEATIAKHRGLTASDKVATVGEWITAAESISEVNPSTFNCYACSLRKIVGDIMSVSRSSKRFGPRNKGGARAYRAEIDSTSLEVLTQSAIQKWRLAYVGRAAKNPVKQVSAMTSCNSTIRQARSLFAPKITKFLSDQKLPSPLPFFEVEFYPRQNAKYFSKIDAKAILQSAKAELLPSEPGAFLALLLALGAGLRRGEIDSLCWNQVDTKNALIRVDVTNVASLKTSDSRGEVEIDENLATILQGFRARAQSEFVIELKPREPSASRIPNIKKKRLKKKDSQISGPRNWGQHYRVDPVFDTLTDWLRKQGVDAKKPLHEMRKELGAMITQKHGIYAASRALRHSSIETTARHYVDKKGRTTVDIGGLLESENVTPITGQEEINQKKAV